MGAGLRTDLYELHMAASYLRRGMTQRATFSLSIRDLPPTRGFLVAAGLEPVLAYLETLSFDDDDLAYLRTELDFDADVVDAFASLRFDGDVWAVPEGTVVFANEPILEVDAPLPTAQLVETVLLNVITTHTVLASKAVRYRLAAPDADLVDFAYRRTHGHDAAWATARSSAIAGFAATSNVGAARDLGLAASGTMAHSYVQAFGSEREAFRAYAQDRRGPVTFLVDTYDTVEGVRAAIDTIEELHLEGALGIRIDSGDLDALSRRTRALLDEAGLGSVRIVVSGGLDEHEVGRLVGDGAPIDVFGIGTQMGVSADAPSLDSVYKLVSVGEQPVMKLSTGKSTLPGAKQVFRSVERGSEPDVLGLREETAPEGTVALLEAVVRSGARVAEVPSLERTRDRLAAELAALPPAARALSRPEAAPVAFSSRLADLATRLRSDRRPR
ncbi:MAG: nicotinate phosphoribosyltransferase [Actinomycetota bacterium]